MYIFNTKNNKMVSCMNHKETGIVIIFGICVLVLLIGALKQKAQIFFRFIGRVALGAVAIYLTNRMLPGNLEMLAVGINPVSLLTVGVLGVGGYGLMYGILIYEMV